MTCCSKNYEVDIFVISGEHVSYLLGRQAACEMGLVARLEEVDAELFGDIGLLQLQPISIQLDENVEPNNRYSQEDCFPFDTKSRRAKADERSRYH